MPCRIYKLGSNFSLENLICKFTCRRLSFVVSDEN